MKLFAKTLAIATFALAAVSPVMAEMVTNMDNCPSAKRLDEYAGKLQLAALDMMAVRSHLKMSGQGPEAIGSSDKELKAMDNAIATARAKVNLCSVKYTLPQVAIQ